MGRTWRWARALLLMSGSGLLLQTASCTTEQQQAFLTSLTSAIVEAIVSALETSLTTTTTV